MLVWACTGSSDNDVRVDGSGNVVCDDEYSVTGADIVIGDDTELYW